MRTHARAGVTRSISSLLAFVLVATPLLTALPAVAYAEEPVPAAAAATGLRNIGNGSSKKPASWSWRESASRI